MTDVIVFSFLVLQQEQEIQRVRTQLRSWALDYVIFFMIYRLSFLFFPASRGNIAGNNNFTHDISFCFVLL